MTDVCDVINIKQFLRRQADRRNCPPNRDPDIELLGWIEGGEVSWVKVSGEFLSTFPAHGHKAAALIDSVWIFAADSMHVEDCQRPAVWYMLQTDGTSTILLRNSLLKGPNWRHGLWFLRMWMRLSWKFWRYAYRAARGVG